MTSTGRGQDMLRTPSQMVEKLSHLADVVSYADFAPTDSQNEVNGALTQQLARDQEQIAGIRWPRDGGVQRVLGAQAGAIVVPPGRRVVVERVSAPVGMQPRRHGDTS